jgi:AcrR family transcriptional regulator
VSATSEWRCEIAQTQLGRMLAAPDRRPDPLTAFRVARRWFLAGRRLEMQELAAELGVNRATLFRWVGGRDDLLGEIIWSLAEPTLRRVIDEPSGQGGWRIATAAGRFATLVDQAPFIREFLRREPERALRILTTRASTVQARMVSAIEALLRDEITHGRLQPPLPPPELAYLIVRIIESFLYADIITGEQLDITKAEQAIAALLVRD